MWVKRSNEQQQTMHNGRFKSIGLTTLCYRSLWITNSWPSTHRGKILSPSISKFHGIIEIHLLIHQTFIRTVVSVCMPKAVFTDFTFHAYDGININQNCPRISTTWTNSIMNCVATQQSYTQSCQSTHRSYRKHHVNPFMRTFASVHSHDQGKINMS